MVGDICSGNTASNPENFAYGLGSMFFKANDCSHGPELWVLNGVTAGIDELKPDADMQLYPNPAQSLLIVKANNPELINADLFICDIQGKQLLHTTANGLQTDIDVSSLQPGIYLLKSEKAGFKSMVKRFVKM